MKKLPKLGKSYVGENNQLIFRWGIDYPIDFAHNEYVNNVNIDLNKDYYTI